MKVFWFYFLEVIRIKWQTILTSVSGMNKFYSFVKFILQNVSYFSVLSPESRDDIVFFTAALDIISGYGEMGFNVS